jgi:hypothetical protein
MDRLKTHLHIPDEIKVDVIVTGVLEMEFRIWLGMWLIRLAAYVMGGVGKIEVEGKTGRMP